MLFNDRDLIPLTCRALEVLDMLEQERDVNNASDPFQIPEDFSIDAHGTLELGFLNHLLPDEVSSTATSFSPSR